MPLQLGGLRHAPGGSEVVLGVLTLFNIVITGMAIPVLLSLISTRSFRHCFCEVNYILYHIGHPALNNG